MTTVSRFRDPDMRSCPNAANFPRSATPVIRNLREFARDMLDALIVWATTDRRQR